MRQSGTMSQKAIAKARALEAKASDLQEAGRFTEAEEPLSAAIGMWKLLQGPKGPDTLAAEMNLAVSYRRRGDAKLALPIFQRVTEELSNHLEVPEARRRCRIALNNQAAAYRDVGELAGAAATLQICISLLDLADPGDEIDIERARVFDNLADVLRLQNQLEEAEAYARKALGLWVGLRGEDDLDVAISLNQLGAILVRRGELAEAREPLERALRLMEAHCGPDHPDVGLALHGVATLELLSGDVPAARALATRALQIGRERLREDHPLVQAALETLALIRQMLGE
jgi:tetratricopeptide (TPR) repeat protein